MGKAKIYVLLPGVRSSLIEGFKQFTAVAEVSDIQLLPRLVYIYPTKEESKVDPIKSQAHQISKI